MLLRPAENDVTDDQWPAVDQNRWSSRAIGCRQEIAAAFPAQARSRVLPFLPDLHRLRASISLRASADAVDAAEADLDQALAIARSQLSPPPELRAARDLARPRAERGEQRLALDSLRRSASGSPKGSPIRISRKPGFSSINSDRLVGHSVARRRGMAALAITHFVTYNEL
jgi:hypothetical protein